MSFPIDLLRDILSLKPPQIKAPMPDEIYQIIIDIIYPEFEKEKIEFLISKVNENLSIVDMLVNESLLFPFIPDLLDLLVSYYEKKEIEISAFSVHILYNYLAWYVNCKQTNKINNFRILLKCLILLNNTEQKEIALKCIISLMQTLHEQKFYDEYDSMEQDIEEICLSFDSFKPAETFYENKKIGEKELTEILKIIKTKPTIVQNQEQCKIVEMISQNISDCNTIALDILIFLQNHYTENAIHVFAPALCEGFCSKMLDVKIEMPEEETKTFEIKTIAVTESALSFPKEETFPNGFDPSNRTQIRLDNDMRKYFGNTYDIYCKIREICAGNAYIENVFIHTFFNFIENQEVSDEAYFKIYTVIVTFIDDLKSNNPTIEALAPKFFSKKVFNPNINIYSHKGNFLLLSTLRYLSLESIVLNSSETIIEMLNYYSKYPLMTSELCERLILFVTPLSQRIKENPKLIVTMIHIISMYQVLERNQTDKKSIQLARHSQFSLLAYLMNDDSITIILLSNPSFMNIFTSFLFEEALQDFVVEKIKRFLMVNNNSCIMMSTINYTLSIAETFGCNKSLVLVSKVFSALNAGLANNITDHIELIESVHLIIPIIPKALSHCSSNETSKELLNQSIILYSGLGSSYILKDIDVNMLSEAINKINDDEYNNTLIPRLIQLLSGSLLPNIQPTFLIIQPKVVQLVLKSRFNGEALLKFNLFIQELCKFSPTNSLILSKGSITNDLIEFLGEAKKKEELSNEVIEVFLFIFSKLSALSSSIQIVQKFVSLLCPFDETHISKYQQLYFNAFNKIISDSSKEPESFISLKDEMIMKETTVPLLEDGFIITFWLNISCNNIEYKPAIISIQYETNNEIRIFASNSSLFFQQIDFDVETTGKLFDSLPYQQWKFCCIVVKKIKKRIIVQYSLDCEQPDIITFPLFSQEPSSKAYVIIGDKIEEEIENPIKVTNIAIYPYIQESSSMALYDCGIRNLIPPPVDPFFEMRQFKNSNIINGFIDVFIKECGAEILLPSFSFSHLKYNNGEPFTFQFECALSALTNILQYSKEVQDSFEKTQGFAVLRELIETKWIDQLSFKLYVSFCSLLISLQSEKLQGQLFEYILTDFNLLLMLDGDLQLKILKHWERVLFESVPNLAEKYKGTKVLIAALTRYYWVNFTEICYSVERRSNTSIRGCRKVLFNIIMSNISKGFKEEDFDALISSMMGSGDVEHQAESFDLLVNCITKYSSAFQFKLESSNFVFLISYFILFPDSNLQKLSLQTLTSAEKYKLISTEFASDLCTSLIFSIKDSSFNESFFEELCSAVVTAPYTLPLLIYISTILGYEQMNSVIHIIAKVNIELKGTWAVWPLVLFISCDQKGESIIRDYLLQSSLIDIKQFFAQIYVFFGKYPKVTKKFEEVFIIQIIYYINGGNQSFLDQIFEVCRKAIFFDKERTPLINVLDDSLLPDPSLKEKTKEQEEFNIKKFIKDLLQDFEFSNLEFGLKFTSQGVWEHIGLGVCLTDLFAKYPLQDQVAFDLLVLSILQRLNVVDATRHLVKIEETVKSVESPQLSYLLNLIRYSISSKRALNGPVVNPLSIKEEKECIIENIYPNKLMQVIKETISQYNETKNRIAEMSNIVSTTDINNYAKKLLVILRIESERSFVIINLGKQTWKKLWGDISIERAPWYNPKLTTEVELTRASFGTYCGVPVRLTSSEVQCVDEVIKDEELYSYKCRIIKLTSTHDATFSIYNHYIAIYSDNHTVFSLSNLTSIRFRYNESTCNRLEFFHRNNFSLLVDFIDVSILDIVIVLAKLAPTIDIQQVDRFSFFQLSDVKWKWINHRITTYEYILELNSIYGRSFNDIDAYPVFPNLEHMDSFSYDKDGVIEMLSRVKPFSDMKVSSEQKKDYMFTVPEMFCMPEVYETEGVRKIIENRTRLESQEVSESINKWIKLAFSELFYQEDHEKRGEKQPTNTLEASHVINHLWLSPIASAFIQEKYPLGFKSTLFMSNGSYSTGSFSVGKKQDSLGIRESVSANNVLTSKTIIARAMINENQAKTPAVKKIPVFMESSDIYPLSLTRYALVTESRYFSIGDTQRPSASFKFDFKNSPVTCIASDGDLIAVGGKNATTTIISGTKITHKIRLFRDSVIACAISKTFGTIVSGTHDSSLILSDIASGSLVKVINIGTKRPMFIKITQKYGFIISVTADLDKGNITTIVCVHTINGTPVYEKSLGIHYKIYFLQTFSSLTRDYFCIGKKGFVLVYNAADVSLVTTIKTTSQPITSIYSLEPSVLNILTQNGEIQSVALRLD